MEPALALICYFVIKVKHGWTWRELWHNRVDKKMVVALGSDKGHIYPRRRYCIDEAMRISNLSIPIAPTSQSLKKILKENGVSFTENEIALLYKDVFEGR